MSKNATNNQRGRTSVFYEQMGADMDQRTMRTDGFGFEAAGSLQITANCYVDEQGAVSWHASVYPRSGFGDFKDYWIEGEKLSGIDGVHLSVPGHGGSIFVMAAETPELPPEEQTLILNAIARLNERRLRWIDNGRPPL